MYEIDVGFCSYDDWTSASKRATTSISRLETMVPNSFRVTSVKVPSVKVPSSDATFHGMKRWHYLELYHFSQSSLSSCASKNDPLV